MEFGLSQRCIRLVSVVYAVLANLLGHVFPISGGQGDWASPSLVSPGARHLFKSLNSHGFDACEFVPIAKVGCAR
jgi:hypothetical protein